MTDTTPRPGRPDELGEGIRRILAPNPSPMTYWGTNTYLVGTRQLAVIDPGPDDPGHLDAILRAVCPGQSISHIFVTHAHLDHSPLACRLARETGAPVLAFGDHLAGRSEIMRSLAGSGLLRGGEGVDTGFAPDITLADGEEVAGDGWNLTAHHSPGHFGNHMSFAMGDVVFTGDLVMGWASSLVSPPDGDLTEFMASCRRLRALAPAVLHAGHGAPIRAPADRIDWLIAHREGREAALLDTLQDGPATARGLTERVYTDTPSVLLPAAERNVLAHLIDLTSRGLCAPLDTLSSDATFALEKS